MSSLQTLPDSQRLSIPFTASSFEALGTAGDGFIGLKLQSAAPAKPSSGSRLFADASGTLSGIDASGNVGLPITLGLFGDGTVAAPSISFTSDSDTGIYRIGANNLGVSVGGAKQIDIGSSGVGITNDITAGGVIRPSAGSVGTPALSFTTDVDTGVYSIGANNLGLAVGGVAAIDIAAAATKIGGQANGQVIAVETLTELTTIAAAATTSTAIQIPAGAVVLGVSARVTTAITCTTTFIYGVAGATSRYGTAVSKAATTTNAGTDDSTRYYGAATAILITPDSTPSDATGRLRVTIWFYRLTPPTS